MSNFEKQKPGNPFRKEMVKKEPGDQHEARIIQELNRLVESARGSLAAEIRIQVALPGVKGDLVGRLDGKPLVRKWEFYSPRFKAETPISSGLSYEALNIIKVTDWPQAIRDLGKPKSITPTFDRAVVVWEKGADQLQAYLLPEQLMEAKVPVQVSKIHPEKEYSYSGEVQSVNGDIAFTDVGKFKDVKLGRGEQSGGYYIAPAFLTKVGAGLSESDRQEVISLLRSTRKEFPVYNAESKLELARRAAKEFPLNDLPKQLAVVGLAESVSVESGHWLANEEVRGSYGDESWGTGIFAEVDHEQRQLLCDGVRINLPESNGILGGTFSRTGDAVARAFLEWGSSYMEKSLEKLKVDLEKVNMKYQGIPDPAIYADFDEQVSSPAEDAAQNNLVTILDELNLRVDEARTAVMLGLERTDPAEAEKKLTLLSEYKKRNQEANAIVDKEKLERFITNDESSRVASRLLMQAEKDAKAKNFLGASSALPEIKAAIERFEKKITEARAARQVYFERKDTLRSKAETLKGEVSNVQFDKQFPTLPRDLLSRIREAARTDLTPARWKAENYEKWNAQAEALLTEVKAAFEAPSAESKPREVAPVQETASAYSDERSQKASFKQEKEKTQAEKLGAALADRARSVLGLSEAIDTIQGELDAPYGRARRQAALKSKIGGDLENGDLKLLYNLSKASGFDEAMDEAINILSSESRSSVPLITKKNKQEKPPETPTRPGNIPAFDASRLFSGR